LDEISYSLTIGDSLVRAHEYLLYSESEQLFCEFFTALASFTMRAEDIPSEHAASRQQQEAFCNSLNAQMNFSSDALKLSPDRMRADPAARASYKLIMNSSLGK